MERERLERNRTGGYIKRDRSRSRSRSPRGRSRDVKQQTGTGKRVYISNIPFDTRWQDVKDLMRTEVGEVTFVELFNDEHEKPRGCGIIEFESTATAKKAIEKMHRFELGGRKIVCKEDYDVKRDKYGRIQGTSSSGGGGGGGGGGGRTSTGGGGRDRDRSHDNDRGDWGDNNRGEPAPTGNTYGLSTSFLEELGIEGPLLCKVFVSNLDFKVDEKKLKEVFKLAGRVIEIELNKDKEGKSRGHGTVEYEHPVEAVQCISMFNGQQLYERKMNVKMDRLADPIADLSKNRLPEGLRSIGMGLGANGQPLVDVSRNLPNINVPSNTNGPSNNNNNTLGTTNIVATPASFVNALANSMNMNQMGLNQLAMMGTQQQQLQNQQNQQPQQQSLIDPTVAAANVFGLNTMNAMGQQFGNAAGLVGGGNTLNSLMQNIGQSIGAQQQQQQQQQQNPVGGNLGNTNLVGGVGVSGNMNMGSTPQNPFQNANNQQQVGLNNQNFRSTGGDSTGGAGDMEFGYSSSSVYSTPSANTNYNTAYQREKFGSGSVGGSSVSGGGIQQQQTSNTVIVSNLPQTCTWQTLKSKFRECGEVLFAEMRDKNTGIVRFANERDAARASKVFDQSRFDGRLIDVRFL